jgi:hypothetical protein
MKFSSAHCLSILFLLALSGWYSSDSLDPGEEWDGDISNRIPPKLQKHGKRTNVGGEKSARERGSGEERG